LYAVDLLAASTCFLLAGGGDGEGELRESSDKVEPAIVVADDKKERKQNTGLVGACARINYIFGYNIIYYLILDQKFPPVFTVTVCALVDSGAGLPVAGVPGLVDDQHQIVHREPRITSSGLYIQSSPSVDQSEGEPVSSASLIPVYCRNLRRTRIMAGIARLTANKSKEIQK
jgi:hypothetical protein